MFCSYVRETGSTGFVNQQICRMQIQYIPTESYIHLVNIGGRVTVNLHMQLYTYWSVPHFWAQMEIFWH